MTQGLSIAPAQGKLGVLLVGLGAVSTTTIAGIMAVRKGIAKPIGAVTQMGTVRLGKRTEGRSPLIKDFVPLATLDDLVFGGWDIFDDDCYEAARTAGVLETSLLEQIRSEDGCRGYQFYGEATTEDSFMLIGEWETRNDWERHVHSEHFAVLLGSLELLSAEKQPNFRLLSHVDLTGL